MTGGGEGDETVVSETSKVVILTSASSGIGEATARHLSSKGGIICLSVPDVEN